MLWLFLSVLTYFIGSIIFLIYESCIGFNIDWAARDVPPLGMASFFWIIALPIIAWVSFEKWLTKTRNERISKERIQRQLRDELDREKERSRYQAEREFIKINAELEKELALNQLMGNGNASKEKNRT
ncbi:hypothetical protein UFOVP1290_307 [uncultured Caudovirales phage]|uniref:Uncharacterized protein n=1 Tax=uncultured Caudovirales phage TaxID=2100421 RepID=A0A6J5RR68_9CAUD|nr:hypothetical protein UFOVP1290_307 [uncultured Caudovirales phage]